MSTPPPEREPGSHAEKLADLDRRLAAARGADAPTPKGGAGKYAATSMAWRMMFELVVSVMIGAAMGWGLDTLFGSMPVFLIVFTLLGFASGVRTMLHSANEMQRKQIAQSADES